MSKQKVGKTIPMSQRHLGAVLMWSMNVFHIAAAPSVIRGLYLVDSSKQHLVGLIQAHSIWLEFFFMLNSTEHEISTASKN